MRARSRTRGPTCPWLAALATAVLLGLGAGAAEAVDGRQLAHVDTVTVVTADEDGARRETTVWLLVLDGRPYIRTGGSTWGDNVDRDPEIRLRSGPKEFAVRAVPVRDPRMRARVTDGMREKYGWQDWLVSFIRGSDTRIWRLDPRS